MLTLAMNNYKLAAICAGASQGHPYAFAICTGVLLTADEVEKIFTGEFMGENNFLRDPLKHVRTAAGASKDWGWKIGLTGKPKEHKRGGVEVNRKIIGPWEEFIVVALKDGKSHVALLSHEGFFSCKNEKGLYADAPHVQTWERFEVINHNDGTFSLRNPHHNKYVFADKNGGSVAGCDRDKIGEWEKFTAVFNEKIGTMSIKAGNGDYFSVQP